MLIMLSAQLIADDLIVDKNSINQYDHDNYVYFNSFNFDGDYQGNHANNPPAPDPTDRINLPETFPILGNQFTIELWVYSEGHLLMNNRTFIGNDANPAGNDFNRPPTITFNLNHQIGVGFGTGSAGMRKRVNFAMTDNQWYHVAWSFDGTISNLYVDGELLESSDFAAGTTPIQVPISIIGRKFIGKIDEVRIWDLVRDQEQIQAVMDSSLSGDESGLIAYYPMEVNEDWKLIDYSSNENHASIVDAEILQKYSSSSCESPDGSSLCPFPTIRDALDFAQSGDNILIAEGRYSEVLFDELVNYTDETEGPKITITGENDSVKLDGTIELNANWDFSNGVYTAQVDMYDISKRAGIQVEDIYGLWVDDRYMIPAMPINFSNPTDPTTSTQNNHESGTIFDLNLTTPYYQPGESTLEMQDPYIVGDINNLDGLEEWSFDKENNVLYLIAGDNIPNDTNVRVRIRTKILSLEFSDNLEFKNIDFFAGTFLFHGSSFILFEDLKFSHSWEVGISYISAGNANYERGNRFWRGTNNTVRNCIFEYINDARALQWGGSMYPLGENILFQYNDWFKNTVWAPSASDNFRGGDKWYSPGVTIGGSTFRYITMDQNHTGGLQPGLESLVEYARIENQYINIDGSGIQRTVGNTIGSTTRYCWLLNTNRNGMRFDSRCAGIDGVVHNVVSAGNKRGFRLKGDWHRAFHLLAYDTNTNDISMPKNKFCGDDWGNHDGANSENNLGNLNSRLLNSIAEKNLSANTPDAGDPDVTGGNGDLIAENISNEFLLNESGIWFGRALDEDHTAPFIHPHLELQDPWFENRTRSVESLESQFGENPYTDANQDYDFRPKKGSPLLDGGVVIPGINDGQDDDSAYPLNHLPLYPGQQRAFVGDAPDIGAYEYGDSVYWIPGYRYSYPSVPIPSDGAIEVSMDYGLAFNYPWKTDYNGTLATVTINGLGINRTETLQYPNNVVFETFLPGETYYWSVTVDGVSGGNWSFTTSDKEYPLNDRSLDTTSVDSMLIPNQINNLQVSHHNLAFFKFDIPSSINNSCIVHLNLVPENVETLSGGIVLYEHNYTEWGEKLNETNIGLVDHSLLTPIDTIFSIAADIPLQIDITEVIIADGVYSFALGGLDSTDVVSFYSKEKLITDGIDIYVEAGDLLGPLGNGSGYAPQIEVWPNLIFQPSDAPVLSTIENQITNEDSSKTILLSATDINGDNFIFSASSADTNVTSLVSNDTLTLTPSADWNGQTTIMVIVTDDGPVSLSDTTTFTFTVNAVNDSPALTDPLPDVTIDEDDFGAVIIPALEVYFNDVDEGDILFYIGSVLGDGLDSLLFSTDNGFNAMANDHGTKIMTIKRSKLKQISNSKVFTPKQIDKDKSQGQITKSFNADSDIIDIRQISSLSRTDSTSLIVYPTENFVGDVEIRIVASDTTGESVSDTLMLSIGNINDAPFVTNAIADIEVGEDSDPLTVVINGVFDDFDIAVGDSLSITAISLADTLVTVDYDSNSVPILLFLENGNGVTDIIVTATDLGGLTANDTVHVTVLPVNDAPSSFALNEQDSVYITMDNFDSDSIIFDWDESVDVDDDELIYHFTAELIINGQLTMEYDTTLTANIMKIDYQSVFDAIYGAQVMLARIEWDVSVSDGIEEVIAENGPLTVGINASDAVLSINKELMPDVYALHQNYPNPFNPITTLRYDLPENSTVKIVIYDMLGREVRSLVNQTQDAGYRSVVWDATNDYGKPVSAGVYLYQIDTGEFVQTRKMVLLK